MTPRETEADARIVIDDLLKRAGWDPSDKSMVATEAPAVVPDRPGHEQGPRDVVDDLNEGVFLPTRRAG